MCKWWEKTVFYQIYMPSFCDGNGDGIGDFKGIESKLEYLKNLGIGCIWLTPFYPSPKVDQGYDVADYYDIDSDYGTMEDFESFINKAHSLGIRVISDVVINHTSTEHKWFIESRSSVDNKKRDWYIWKSPKNGQEPNNWESFFGEKAWEYDAGTDMYYYHSFSKEQADLNWANPEVKKAVFQMLDFWIDKGIDGFRLDVINNLSLTAVFDDNPYDENTGNQIHEYDINQKGIHGFLRELKQYLNRNREIFLVGEISSDVLENIYSYAGDGMLDTTFNFNLGSIKEFSCPKIYDELNKMSKMYKDNIYPTIFFGSHDMPRFSNRFNFDDKKSKILFTIMMGYKGIPFIYNGDEIGMTGYHCDNINDARDIQGIIAYKKAIAEGKTESAAIEILNSKSRDNSRNTMYWNDGNNGGFTSGTPWINYQKPKCNSVEIQLSDKESLLRYLSKLINIRVNSDILSYGNCEVIHPQQDVIVCKREYKKDEVWIIANYSGKSINIVTGGIKDAHILIETVNNGIKVTDDKLICNSETGGMIYFER